MFAERANYVVEPIKSRDIVPKTILGGILLAVCTNFPPELLHDITFDRRSNAVFIYLFLMALLHYNV